MSVNILTDVPDPQDHGLDATMHWLNSRIDAVRHTKFTPEIIATFAPIELLTDFSHPCGPEAFAEWRRFFLATLLADWCSYDTPVDRVDFARLKYIMTSAYRYTRLWCCRFPDGQMTPVGYSAWYPIAKFVYDGILQNAAEVNDRGMIMPLRYVEQKDMRYTYVFNASIAKELRNTHCSRRLVRALQRDNLRLGHAHVLAATVAEDGQRLSRIAKLASAGDITVQGMRETLYVRKPIRT